MKKRGGGPSKERLKELDERLRSLATKKRCSKSSGQKIMTPHTETKLIDGETCVVCLFCGAVLVRIEKDGILGDQLNTLDEIVVGSHMLLEHGSGKRP